MQLGLGLGITRLRTPLNEIVAGLRVLSSYGSNAHLWLPGTGYLNGTSVGNYLDSAGSTAASVDNPVGLVLDNLQTFGPELAPGMIDFTSTAWTKGAGAVAPSATIINFPAVSAEVFQFNTGENSANKSYFIKFTASGNGTLSVGVTNTVDYAPRAQLTLTGTPQVFTISVTQNSTTVSSAAISFCRQAGDTCTQATITAVSWKQQLGIPASQPTTANKPKLVRGVTNLLTYSGGLTNSNWVKTYASVVTGVQDPLGGTTAQKIVEAATDGAHVITGAVTNGVGVFTGAAIVQAAGRPKVVVTMTDFTSGDAATLVDLSTGSTSAAPLTAGSWSGISASSVALGGGWYLVAVNGTRGAGSSMGLGIYPASAAGAASYVGDGASGINFYRGAIFNGTLTAQQILTCGGIPLTTTAPASSATGNFGWQGDGTSKYLQLAFAPGITNACTIVAGISASSLSTTQAIYGEGVGGVQLYFGTNGQLVFDKGGTGDLAQYPSVVVAGTPVVITARLSSGNAVIRKNGTQLQSAPTSITFSGSSVQLMATTTAFWLNGTLYPIVVLPVGVPDSDLLAIERMIGALTGPTGISF